MGNKILILAGGRGTRLSSIIDEVPKPMAPIRNKPFLYYIFEYTKNFEIDEIILSVGYKKKAIMNCFKSQYNGINIKYICEDIPLGTGGAISEAFQQIEAEDIIVMNGDTLFFVDLNDFIKKHKANNSILSIALKPHKKNNRFGSVEIDVKNRIIGFFEKKNIIENFHLINGGIYMINRTYYINKTKHFENKFSFESDFLTKYFSEDTYYGFPYDQYFIDIGIPEDYVKAKNELSKKGIHTHD